MGNVLVVDLTRRTTYTRALDDAFYRAFIGGYGIAVRVTYAQMPIGVDPFSPLNVLGFTPGLLTGTGVPGYS